MSEVIRIWSNLYYFFMVAEGIVSLAMGFYGYKWRKGLIATASLYIGVGIGILCAGLLLNVGVALGEALIVLVGVPVAFWFIAYKIIPLNHFLAGFLLTLKISYMILYTLQDNEILQLDIKVFFILPIIIGIISGSILLICYNNYIVILCLSFISAVNFGTKIAEMIDKGTFLIKPDIGYFLNLDTILNCLGIETVTLLDVVIIMGFFALFFTIQKNRLIKYNIDLTDVPMDDRKYFNG